MAVPLDFKSPFVGGTAFYLGVTTYTRTATGSGLGTESAVRLIASLRTATGSGTGTSTTVEIKVRVRVGSASAGTGSSTVSQVLSRIVTGSGFGTGSSTTIELHVSPRTATSSGTGTESTVQLLKILRIASDAGTGSSVTVSARIHYRAATGSGTGSAVSVHYKFHMFRPPVELVGPFMLLHGDKIANKLGRRFEPFERGKNVYQLNNLSFTENDPWSPDNYIKVFHGGHVHALTEDEYTDLVAAGYGANIT